MPLNQKLLAQNCLKISERVGKMLHVVWVLTNLKSMMPIEEKPYNVNEQKFQVFNGWRHAHNFNEEGTN